MTSSDKLRAVRVVHTLVWLVFGACVLLIPVFAYRNRFGIATALIVVVFGEVAILAANHMRCPLTDVAARYTDDRRDNFDIYLPIWLARYNKAIFGTLYVVGIVYALLRWANVLG